MTSIVELMNAAVAEHQRGNLDRAESGYRELLRLRPDLPEAHNNLGLVLDARDRLDDAIACYRMALAARPAYADALNNLGSALRKKGATVEGEAAYREALRLAPDKVEALNNLANLFMQQGRLEEAVVAFEAALQKKPDSVEILYNLGQCQLIQGNTEPAMATFQRASELAPRSAMVLCAVGRCLQLLGRLTEARDFYRRANIAEPNASAPKSLLGGVLQAEGNYRAAIAQYQAALELAPEHVDTLASLGGLHLQLGEHVQAAKLLEQAYQLAPGAPQVAYNRGLLKLTLGEFAEGWQGFEFREQCYPITQRDLPQPRWNGQPAEQIVLLIHCLGGGLGDIFQFIRYLPLVQARVGHVWIEVPAPIVPLLRQSGFEGAIPTGEPLPHFDQQIPLLSLPGLFATTLENIPGGIPYITADRLRRETWKQRLQGIDGFRIGIHWQGNPQYSSDRMRSMPLASFAPLARLPGVQLIGLQKGAAAQQIGEGSGAVPLAAFPDLDQQGGAFLDTAAVLGQLDLVVTSDSALAHLAGAMGVRTWVALSAGAEWRWMRDRGDSPWYPSLQLFRQRQLDDWDELFARLAQEVKAVAGV